MRLRRAKPVRLTIRNGIGMDQQTFELLPGQWVRTTITWTENYRDTDGRLPEGDRSIPLVLFMEHPS